MIPFDDVPKENIKKYNPNWLQIPNHPHRILIIRSSGSGKTNSLFNLISQKPDIDKIYLYLEDPYKAKYQFLNSKKESAGLKDFNDSKAFMNTQMIWMIFVKPLKNINQIKNVKY